MKVTISNKKINFNPELLLNLGIKQIKVSKDSFLSYAGQYPISAIYIHKGQVDLLKNNAIKQYFKGNFIIGFSELLEHIPIMFDIKIRYGSELYFLSKDNLKLLMHSPLE